MMSAPLLEDPRIGSVLDGRYRILARLSAGGMGVVYRGERLQLGRPVAIKFLLAPLTHEPAQRASFEREAKVMSRLNHPHCVPVTDFGVSDAPYLVMEYVAGRTLKQLLAEERLSPARAVRLARQLLSGLAHAHALGIVHHDVKPANIMLSDATGVGEQVRVLDFGLAKLREAGEEGEPTAPALLAGTPHYMAPEQWQQAGLIDPRSDVYAAGIVLFEMLTGRRPFDAREPFEVLRAHAERTPPPLASLCPSLGGAGELEAVLQRALQKAPEHRFASASEFAAALEALPALSERADEGPLEGAHGDAVDTSMAATLAVAARPDAHAVEVNPPRMGRTTRRRLWLVAPLAACVGLAFGLGHPPFGQAPKTMPPTASRRAPRYPLVDAPVARAAEPPLSPEPRFAPADAPRPGLEDLLAQGAFDAALTELGALRAAQPNDARLLYLEGRALYEKGWWREAYERYRQAIRLDGSYRFDRQLTNDLVRGLGSTSAQAMAREVLRMDLGRAALRPLARAARNDHRSVVRQEAQRLHDELARN